MTINKSKEGNTLIFSLEGRLDTNTAVQLENASKESLGNATILVMDFSGVAYVSSAGLRVILSIQKQMSKKGKLIIRNVNETVMEVFEMTGFSGILTIE